MVDIVAGGERSVPTVSAIREFRSAWRVVCAALLGMLLCCLPGAVTGVFMSPWADTFGWSLSAIGGVGIFVGLGAAISSPIVGRLMDRFGSQRVILAYVPILALSVLATTFIGTNIWSLYLAMFVRGLVATGLGAYTRVVSAWFEVGRGTAIALICIGVGLSTVIGPPMLLWVVDAYGWQMGHYLLTVLVLCAWPLALLWLPERREIAACSVAALRQDTGYTRQEAMKTAMFWLLGGSFLLWGLTAGGSLFLIPFLTSHGMSRADAASRVSMLGVVIVLGQPFFGLLIDRWHAPFVAAAALLVSTSAFVLLAVFGSRYAIAAVPMMGIASSAWMSCLDYSTARFFGLRSFSEISGWIDRMACVGVMIGQFGFGLLLQMTGGYQVSYLAIGVLGAGSAICMLSAGRYPFPRCFDK